MTQKYNPAKNTVLSYLNYCLLRIKNGYVIEEKEEENTYDYYCEYCKQNEIMPYSSMIFFRELKKVGIESKQVYDKDKGRIRKRELTYDNLSSILQAWNSDNIVHSSKLTIGEDDYQLVIKLIKIKKEIRVVPEIENNSLNNEQ